MFAGVSFPDLDWSCQQLAHIGTYALPEVPVQAAHRQLWDSSS
jgi:hypothetical protein